MKKTMNIILLVMYLCTVFCGSAYGDQEEFSIEDGAIVRYNGPGGNVTIPNGVVSIDENAFRNCENLISITIPTGVTKIGSGAFENSKNLKK